MKTNKESIKKLIDNDMELNQRVVMLTDLVEAMIPLQQDMYNKIQFLEKRINLIEQVDDYQDKELETLWNNTERNEKFK